MYKFKSPRKCKYFLTWLCQFIFAHADDRVSIALFSWVKEKLGLRRNRLNGPGASLLPEKMVRRWGGWGLLTH